MEYEPPFLGAVDAHVRHSYIFFFFGGGGGEFLRKQKKIQLVSGALYLTKTVR
jgi:hypothetical protein